MPGIAMISGLLLGGSAEISFYPSSAFPVLGCLFGGIAGVVGGLISWLLLMLPPARWVMRSKAAPLALACVSFAGDAWTLHVFTVEGFTEFIVSGDAAIQIFFLGHMALAYMTGWYAVRIATVQDGGRQPAR